MITANCRDRFTAEDFRFVVETLARKGSDSVSLVSLLTDGDCRDQLLDQKQLLQAMLENHLPLSISPQLYFYVLVRHALKDSGLDDRRLSDYVASLLESFSNTARMRSPGDGATGPIQYVSDMLIALRQASSTQQFLIRAHVGNYSLFISGIFHERVESRAQRGGPDVEFYEEMGRSNFKTAASHAVARTAELTPIFEHLASRFHDVRVALNRVSSTLLHLDDPHHHMLALS